MDELDAVRAKLIKRIDGVLVRFGDPEGGHSAEDKLMRDIIKLYAPDWLLIEMGRLWNDETLIRWYA